MTRGKYSLEPMSDEILLKLELDSLNVEFAEDCIGDEGMDARWSNLKDGEVSLLLENLALCTPEKKQTMTILPNNLRSLLTFTSTTHSGRRIAHTLRLSGITKFVDTSVAGLIDGKGIELFIKGVE